MRKSPWVPYFLAMGGMTIMFLLSIALAFFLREGDDLKEKTRYEQAIIEREAKQIPVSITLTGWFLKDYASPGRHIFPGFGPGVEVEIGPDGRGTIKMAGGEFMQLKGEMVVQKK